MAIKLEFTFEDETEAQITLKAFCLERRYEAQRLSEQNPNWIQTEEISETNPQYIYESKLEFFTRMTIQYWKDTRIQGEIKADYIRKADLAKAQLITAKIL